jgi:hypothetical protein
MANTIKIKRALNSSSGAPTLVEGELAYNEYKKELYIGATGSSIDTIGGTEAIADTVGAMFSAGTQSGLTVTYDDSDNSLDLNVNDPTVTVTGGMTGSFTMTNLGNAAMTLSPNISPAVTLGGDLGGTATFTNLGNATLNATIQSNAVQKAMVHTDVITGQAALAANPDGDNDYVLIYDASASGYKKIAAKYLGANSLSELDNVGSDTATAANLLVADGTKWQSVAMSGDVLVNSAGVATIQANSVALATDTTGNFVGSGAVAGTGLSGSLSAEGGTFTVTSNATATAGNGTIVSRDGSGNFAAGTVTADLTGDVTGDVTGDLTGDVTGNVFGDLTGLVLTAVQPAITSVGTLSSLAVSSHTTVGGNLSVTGNLTVDGTMTAINSTTMTVDDKNIELGSTATPTDTTANGGGLTLKGDTDKTIIWDNTTDNWTLNQDISVPTGKVYKINDVSVLSATALGSSVISSSLASVGTIGTGTWEGSTVGAGFGGTGIASFTPGDTMYASGTTTVSKLAKGTAGQIMVMNGAASAPSWTNTLDGGTY